MRHIYRLPVREQMMVFRALREYLGNEIGEENIFDKEIRERQGALGAMRRVADHWRLEANVAPTATQHKQTPSEVTDGWSVTRVGEAWGRYRFAQQALRGEAVPETVAQQRLRRSTSGRARAREDYVSGVRRWLETNPASSAKPGYDDYARQHNSGVLSGKEGMMMVGGAGVMAGLGLRWPAVLRLCEEGADYDALRAEALREHLAKDYGPLGLVTSEGVGHMLGRSSADVMYLHKRGMLAAVPVLILARARGWFIKDIEAFVAGRQVPSRQENELRPQVMNSNEVAHLVGVTRNSLNSMLHKSTGTVPPPDGCLSLYLYWMREKTERWVAEHSKPVPHPRRGNTARTNSDAINQASSR